MKRPVPAARARSACLLELPSPIGPLTLVSDGDWLTALHLGAAAELPFPSPDRHAAPVLVEARAQLAAYFAGALRKFELPLRPHGTAFQERVWIALSTLPFGATCSYGQLAEQIGAPGSARAVGAANGQNPIAIIIPCHRVIGATGRLVGYGGGIARKTWLLEHEKRVAATQLTLV